MPAPEPAPATTAAGDSGQAEIKLQNAVSAVARCTNSCGEESEASRIQSAGALQAKRPPSPAGGGRRRGRISTLSQRRSSRGRRRGRSRCAVPGGIAAQRPVVNIDGRQRGPSCSQRSSRQTTFRQFAAQPPGFSRITRGGSAGGGELVDGQAAKRSDGHRPAGVRVPLDRNTRQLARRPPEACGATSSKNNP